MDSQTHREVERRPDARDHYRRRPSRSPDHPDRSAHGWTVLRSISGRRSSTALVGTTAVGLALLLALPDLIWVTVAQFAFIGAVLLVAVACTWAAGILEPLIPR